MHAYTRATECTASRVLSDGEGESVPKRPLQLRSMILVPMCLLGLGLLLVVLRVLDDGHNMPPLFIRRTPGTAAAITATVPVRSAGLTIFSR